jgi:hypothetical protein
MPLALDAEEIVSNHLEQNEFHEDAIENISKEAFSELQCFVDDWCKRHPVSSYYQNTGVVVDLTKEVEAYLKEQHDGT